MKFFETKYRIITDNYSGYEIQYKKWWMPFYMQSSRSCLNIMGINTFMSVEQALKAVTNFIMKEKSKNKVVWESSKDHVLSIMKGEK